ncbi:MAG: ring-opening amidohydrolase [Burkholderiales bacterium]|nr:ring-opening amidohydrolase [Burkholderiales bacterium]
MNDRGAAQKVDVFKIPMAGPADVSGLARLIDQGALDPRAIVAILGKTEGNGCVNDFTREYATAALAGFLAERLGLAAREIGWRIAFVMSGGTEGVLSPHMTVFARSIADRPAACDKRLAIGIASTREFLPEELGRSAQIKETEMAVKAAMANAGIENAADVHFVQIKCPLLTTERMQAAHGRRRSVVTEDAYASMGYSRGASALGVAVALGEVSRPSSDDIVMSDWSAYSAVASTSAGIELMRNVVILMGNSPWSASRFVIGHSVMKDAIDLQGVVAAFRSAGLDFDAAGRLADPQRLVNVFVKAEASPSGKIRGARHTMLDDSDINSTRHARAAVGGLIAGVSATTQVYVSGGAEHQGPAGGGPIAVIAHAGNV